jgi:hypothetical protein
MSDDFLSRWSRLKKQSTQPVAAEPPVAVPVVAPPAIAQPVPPPEPLPPVESLCFESDFTAFMKPEVDGILRRQALKTLFQDPRFNVMDGLDVYIDDYSKPDPLPAGWLERMNLSRLGDYQPPLEEADPPVPEAAAATEKGPQNEALATPAEPLPSDTLEAPTVPPAVPESEPPA